MQTADQVPELGRGFVAAEGDIGTWGRNWHEMVILSGIEMQRQRASYQDIHSQMYGTDLSKRRLSVLSKNNSNNESSKTGSWRKLESSKTNWA